VWNDIDSKIEKLPDMCRISMHNEFVGGVRDGERVQVGAWVHGQLARVGMFHAVN